MEKDKQKKLFVGWLKDAYAMEKSIEKTLKAHVKDAKDYPEIRDKINHHIMVTQSQAERLKNRLEEMDEKPSVIKKISGEIMQSMQGYATRFAEDKIIKNTLAEIATENFEIATYEALKAAAERVGDTESAMLAEEIKKEEEEMGSWAKKNLPILVDRFLAYEEMESEENKEELGEG